MVRTLFSTEFMFIYVIVTIIQQMHLSLLKQRPCHCLFVCLLALKRS